MTMRKKSKARTAADKDAQLQRFKEMAREVAADESLDALDRAFGRLDIKKTEIAKPVKRIAKEKR